MIRLAQELNLIHAREFQSAAGFVSTQLRVSVPRAIFAPEKRICGSAIGSKYNNRFLHPLQEHATTGGLIVGMGHDYNRFPEQDFEVCHGYVRCIEAKTCLHEDGNSMAFFLVYSAK